MEQELLKSELEQLHSRAKVLKQEVEAIWKDDVFAAYELTSVFVHRGTSPSWGHYFFYSRHLPDEPDSWFKYNDSDVSVVSKDEVLADTTGSTANPYLVRWFCVCPSNFTDHVVSAAGVCEEGSGRGGHGQSVYSQRRGG